MSCNKKALKQVILKVQETALLKTEKRVVAAENKGCGTSPGRPDRLAPLVPGLSDQCSHYKKLALKGLIGYG